MILKIWLTKKITTSVPVPNKENKIKLTKGIKNIIYKDDCNISNEERKNIVDKSESLLVTIFFFKVITGT